MIVRSVLAAIATVAIPIAVVGAAEPAAKRSDFSTKRVCGVNQPTGSRLGGVRRCRTHAERKQEEAEAKQIVDRIQLMKPTICGPTTKNNC